MTHRIYGTSFNGLYPAYVAKAERKGRTKAEVDAIVCWLTGHTQQSLDAALATSMTVADFFGQAPEMNASRNLVTGVVCGVRVEAVEEPLMREIRRLDKMIDELAKGRAMDKILRG
ncbi:DUF2200 domain-containing protein [Sphingomonas radiodurans]|uniref:DUF2200 domain-containing protein n=1 Tax=Sphingomonas radiodurans TaxID=2890321 RepID=UPI001E478C8D|nr:DUF2200 domain-containing protein [Sphingomonas radiodurans]WBH15839.1 DUF2200 domain-containing protein [Sphingomonas radiodurans]